MNKLLISAATVAALASPAAAIDLGNKFSLINTVESTYSVETEDLVAGYTAKLQYDFNDSLLAYASTNFDLEDPNFTGVNLGVELEPNFGYATLSAKAKFDSELEYTDAVLGLKIEF